MKWKLTEETVTDKVTRVFLPLDWEATPYGDHWAFAYTTDKPDREDFDFRVEFDESVCNAEQHAIIRLLENAPALLDELSRIGHHVQVDTGHFNRIQRLLAKVEGVEE